MPIASWNPKLRVDAHTETIGVNLNEYAISNNVNEITTPLLSPKNNRSSIENNCDCLINSTLSYEEGSFLSSVNFRCSNSKHVDNNLQESIIINNRKNETANISHVPCIIRCEKFIRHLQTIRKVQTFF